MSSTWLIENKFWLNEDKIYKDNGNGTGTLLVPINTVLPLPAAIPLAFLLILISTLFGGFIVDINSFGSNAIEAISYTQEQLSSYSYYR